MCLSGNKKAQVSFETLGFLAFWGPKPPFEWFGSCALSIRTVFAMHANSGCFYPKCHDGPLVCCCWAVKAGRLLHDLIDMLSHPFDRLRYLHFEYVHRQITRAQAVKHIDHIGMRIHCCATHG